MIIDYIIDYDSFIKKLQLSQNCWFRNNRKQWI